MRASGPGAATLCTGSDEYCAAAPTTSPSTPGRRLLSGIEAGDDDGQVAKAWVAAQELRAIYGCRDGDHAANRLYDWTVLCIDSGVAELARLARTITTWREEFLAYFSAGRISNGPTEAVNLLIKKVKRVGHGFRNFSNYRLRLLLHCGIRWKHRVAKVRFGGFHIFGETHASPLREGSTGLAGLLVHHLWLGGDDDNW